MGACYCTVNNSKKLNENQITPQDKNQIHDQLKNTSCTTSTLQKHNPKIMSLNKIQSIKQKALLQYNQDSPYVNWSSLINNKQVYINRGQKRLSQFSNTINSANQNRSHNNNLEEKQSIRSDQTNSQNQIQLPKKFYKQTAKHRNRQFNQSSLLNQGVRQEDNSLIQRTFNIDKPIKLQSIQLKVGVTYYGEWLNGMRHGFGIQIWQDQSRYEGPFYYNQQNGYAVLRYGDGDVYDGYWRDDYYHGQGKLTSKNGHSYEGQWYQGKKQGKGKQIWEDGQIYIGQYKDDFKHGRGIMTYKDKSYYEGQFSQNQIHGRGKYIWKNSRQYDGEWVKNKMHGFGILKWADGRYYKGQFQNDKRHGKGQMYYINGTRYNGNWKNGKQNGHGQIYQGTKLKFVGQWKDGKKIKKNNKEDQSSSLSYKS